jgi:hypothetical protein
MTPLAVGAARVPSKTQVGIEVTAGPIDRGEVQREETELARGHLQLTAHG